MDAILDELKELKDIVCELRHKVEKLEEIADKKYCYKCETIYHKTIPSCWVCERPVCENCGIENCGRYHCPRRCCNNIK